MSSDEGALLTTNGKVFRRRGERWLVKGIAYGPFEQALEANPRVRADLEEIRALKFNAVRLYQLPAPSFCQLCAELELDLFVGLPWGHQHDFLSRVGEREEVLQTLVRQVEKLALQPAIAGYFVGNEIPAGLVRWMEVKRVRAFLEELIRRLRAADPRKLLAYANYPSTEYLQPRNADFSAFNIYLESPKPFRDYLYRLHHLADDRPLVVSEFGLDTFRNGETKQAETLDWFLSASAECGAAGVFLFTFTDEWFNGGRLVTDWCFGLVDAERRRKPAGDLVARRLPEWTIPAVRLARQPRVCVIVCTHNGHATLPKCLASLQSVDYEQADILVVDDGSRAGIEEMCRNFSRVRYLAIPHSGLSAARNAGAAATEAEILVYTDDDCEVDRDWLTHLVAAFESRGYDACGGPNLAPAATSTQELAVQLAPGNPAHVMADDLVAEHLPGCNLAVTRAAFHAVGGFREHYRTAGDDVDFCWRLHSNRFRLGFEPMAFVWHRRRSGWWAFTRQQMGYGRAEALLQWDHPERFGRWGGMNWKGTVYAPPETRRLVSPIIYFGPLGKAPFQLLYQAPDQAASHAEHWTRSFPWWAATIGCLLLGLTNPFGWWLALTLFLVAAGTSTFLAWRVCLRRTESSWPLRLWLTWLHLAPPVARRTARWFASGPRPDSRSWWRMDRAFSVRSDDSRESLLQALEKRSSGAPRALQLSPNEWSPWDLLLSSKPFAYLLATSVAEKYRHDERVVRVSIQAYLKPWVRAVFFLLLVLALGQVASGHWLGGALLTLATVAAAWGLHLHTKKELATWIAVADEEADALGFAKLTSATDDEESETA